MAERADLLNGARVQVRLTSLGLTSRLAHSHEIAPIFKKYSPTDYMGRYKGLGNVGSSRRELHRLHEELKFQIVKLYAI